MVVHMEGILPSRCIKCNDYSVDFVEKVFPWHPPTWYLVFMANMFVIHIVDGIADPSTSVQWGQYVNIVFWLLVFVVVSKAIPKTVIIQIPLCDKHLSYIRATVWGGYSLITFGLILSYPFFPLVTRAFGSPVIVIVGILICMDSARILVRKRTEENYVWFKGPGKDFLRQLPPARQNN